MNQVFLAIFVFITQFNRACLSKGIRKSLQHKVQRCEEKQWREYYGRDAAAARS